MPCQGPHRLGEAPAPFWGLGGAWKVGSHGPHEVVWGQKAGHKGDLWEWSPRCATEPDGAETSAVTRVPTCPDCQDSPG